jgi:hypothetical protein
MIGDHEDIKKDLQKKHKWEIFYYFYLY